MWVFGSRATRDSNTQVLTDPTNELHKAMPFVRRLVAAVRGRDPKDLPGEMPGVAEPAESAIGPPPAKR